MASNREQTGTPQAYESDQKRNIPVSEEKVLEIKPADVNVEPSTRRPPELTNHLMDKDIHPVLIVGTKASGKTTMLQSLIYFMRRNNKNKHIDIRLGASAFPESYDNEKDRYESAAKFYNVSVQEFSKRRPTDPTSIPAPFFIPIDLFVGNDVFKFAFYEGMGEWFHKEGDSSAYYKDFKPEFAEIITNFTKPLSIIFLAPSVDDTTQTREYAHLCIDNAITQYHAHRVDSNADHALLIFSKWDKVFKPSDKDGHFSDATPQVMTEIMEDWEYVWPKFRGVKLAGPRAKSLMPYAAAWINENNEIVRTSERYQHIFDKFNRTIWNWLYLNAIESRKTDSKRPIYSDVALQTEPPESILWKIAKRSLWLKGA